MNAGVGSGKDWELEAEVWALRARGCLTEAWLHLTGSPHRPKVALLLPESWESWSRLHWAGAGKQELVHIKVKILDFVCV